MNARRLVIVPHTHWDREWYMPFERFRKRLVAMVDHLLAVLEDDPHFAFFELDGQTIVLDDYLEIRPENRRRLEKLIRQGRIRIGPWYIQPDEFLVTGESIIRNLRLGIRSAQKYGKASLVGYLPDQFGHIAQMPQIMKQFGIQSAVVWRGVGKSVDQAQFLWEAPDGTQLFTIYLADSYSNGAYLPLTAKEFRARLSSLVEKLSPYCSTGDFLIMNGTDHLEPQDGLPRQVAALRLDGMACEMGSLGAFINQVRRQARALPVHQGEFRSTQRAPLLPGVTSTRIRQKQRAFICARMLEKYIEPLSTWATLCGDDRPHQSFVEHAWRLVLQNQPHDSICGCSVDKVHEEMETRFDRVEQVGKSLLKDSLSFLANHADSRFAQAEEPVLCVYNPAAARSQFVDVEVDLEEPDFVNSVRDANGNVLPLQKSVGRQELYFRIEDTPGAIRQMVAGMETREVMGYFINNVLWRIEGDTLMLTLVLGRAPAGEVDFPKRRQELMSVLANAPVEKVRVSGVSGAKTRIVFAAESLAPQGLSAFSLSHESAGALAEDPPNATPSELENQFYRITINSDGTLTILDKELNKEFRRCLHFVDEGDRGDTYNFDEVPDGAVVDAPAGPVAVSVVENGPVRASVRIEAIYRIPERLSDERDARSSSTIETAIATLVSLNSNAKRIDFQTSLDNRAEDHRLRVLFNTHVHTHEAKVESTFAVVHRSPAPQMEDGSVEQPVNTGPQKSFTCLENEAGGAALFNRGIPEIEAVPGMEGAALAFTLVRSVGWLSRDDLVCRPNSAGPQFQTPGAQSKGRHSFEYAFTSYAGKYEDAGIVGQAHAYAYPPVAAVTNRHKGGLKSGASLVASDNARICVSAIEPSRQKQAYLVRLYNSTGTPREARLSLWGKPASVYEVNFLERKLSKEALKARGGKVALSFGPAEIKTLQVSLK